MTRVNLAPALTALVLCAAAAGFAVPRGLKAQSLIAIADDPAQIADRAVAQSFDATRAAQEIDAALAANDADLAQSFVALAAEQNLTLDPAQTARVDVAVAEAGSMRRALESFAMGFANGEPKDIAGFAGTAVSDLMIIGDIRDAARESAHLIAGEPADQLVLGLAGVGLALTAATVVTAGEAAPARVGVSLAKAARKTGHLDGALTERIGQTLSRIVDWGRLKTAIASASVTEPSLAVRGARDAIKLERAGDLVALARDVGRVQAKAGTQAALEGLKVAESPREMSRLARLAETKGGKMRAILRLAGRGAIALSVAAIDLALWIAGALVTVFGVVCSLKSATERMTQRAIDRGKARRHAARQRFAAMTGRG